MAALNPEQPWLQREDWAVGRIVSSAAKRSLSLWAFAVLWNSLIGGAYFFIPKLFSQSIGSLLILCLFALVGVALIVWAVRETIRDIKFGSVIFQMDDVPGVLGRALTGKISVSQRAAYIREFSLKLTCVRITTRQLGDNTSTMEETVWQSGQQVTPDAATGIPVAFALPADLPETFVIRELTRTPFSQIFWRLKLVSIDPGTKLVADFEVPVFKGQS